ncbi:hypothetical protein MRB53_040371 [Persea americana]|nr:hypothetical protein MRB53_040371 [Persea americana]
MHRGLSSSARPYQSHSTCSMITPFSAHAWCSRASVCNVDLSPAAPHKLASIMLTGEESCMANCLLYAHAFDIAHHSLEASGSEGRNYLQTKHPTYPVKESARSPYWHQCPCCLRAANQTGARFLAHRRQGEPLPK